MKIIVDRSLTAARGLAMARRQRGKRLYDSGKIKDRDFGLNEL